MRLSKFNAQPVLLVSQDGALTNAFLFEVTAEGVTAIYAVRNPKKLTGLARGMS